MAGAALRGAVERVCRVPAEGDSRVLVAVSAGLVACTILLTGRALGWSIPITVLGAASLAASTVLARSVSRAFLCLLAAIAVLAMALALLVAIADSLPATLHVEWRWVAVAWWGLPVLLAWACRRHGVRPAFGAAELAALAVVAFLMVELHRIASFRMSLLPYLVRFEDNQAWVGIVTQVRSEAAIGPGFVGFGPVVPTLLGLLATWQKAGIPDPNAAFGAYMLVFAVLPLVAVGLLRHVRAARAAVVAAGAVILCLWALHVPVELLVAYGHLSAALAILALVAVLVVSNEVDGPSGAPVGIAIAFFAGAVWFPAIPFAAAVLVALGVVAFRSRSGGWGRWSGVALAALAVALLVHQLLVDTLGLTRGVGSARDTMAGLYAAGGATASLDATVQILVLAGVVALSFAPGVREGALQRQWLLAIAATLFAVAVFAGASAFGTGAGYGPTKVWYVVGWTLAILIASVPVRLGLPWRPVAAMLAVLLMGTVLFGATTQVLGRSFIGAPDNPDWLPGLERVASQDPPGDPHPVACFANDFYQAYRCTRWAAGLTVSGDDAFYDYRMQVVGHVDPTTELRRLEADGTLARSWVLMVDRPDADHAWAWGLIARAGRVYDLSGVAIEPRPAP